MKYSLIKRLMKVINRKDPATNSSTIDLTIDRLTGLYNLNGFHYNFGKIIGECRREETYAGVIVCDPDGLTSIDPKSDGIIKGIANSLLRNLRSEDIIARYNANRFLVGLKLRKGRDIADVVSKLKDETRKIYGFDRIEDKIYFGYSAGIFFFEEPVEKRRGVRPIIFCGDIEYGKDGRILHNKFFGDVLAAMSSLIYKANISILDEKRLDKL